MSTIPDLTNTSSWPDEDLTSLHSAVLREMTRRQTLAEAVTRTTEIAAAYLDARDGTQPSESPETLADTSAWPVWVQPTGAHDSYPAGWIVKHGGVLYQSLIAANVWEPGSTGAGALWEKVTAGAAWDGGGHAYKVGDLVEYQGTVYRVVQAHTSQAAWTPTAAPSLWVAV